MVIFIYVLLTLFFVVPVQATYAPHLYQNTPLISPTENFVQYFQSSIARQPYGYGMWFSASDGQRVKIAIARSANGVDWYAHEVLNVTNNLHAHDPSLLVEDNTYHLFFGSSNGGPISIWSNTAQADNDFNPDNAQQMLSSREPWEGSSLSSPHIFKVANIYYLLYAGNGNGKWQIGLAESTDGKIWNKCTQNPILPEGSGPAFVIHNGTSLLFYNSPRGLEYVESTDFKGCQTQWSIPQIITNTMGNPNPLEQNNDIWLYGDYSQGIGLMSQEQIAIQYPTILIPGMFASWNKNAILHNQDVMPDDWKINPVVTEYDSLISAFNQLGYSENGTFFIFPYDWRQPIKKTTEQLDLFIQSRIWRRNQYQPVQIIGHSLGGVISHIYGSDNSHKKPIKKSISVAAPLRGTLQSYKPLAAGEIERENTLTWLAENIILQLNAGMFTSKKDVVRQYMPVLFDLVPTYSFLFNNTYQPINSLIANNVLMSYPIHSENQILTRIAGTEYETKYAYTLSERTPTDILLNIYPDGHPTSTQIQYGDGLVPENSASIYPFYTAKALHGETIYRDDFLHAIFDKLDLDSSQVTLLPGKQTPIFPAILLFLQSPATMRVVGPTGTSFESDSYIHLTNTMSGKYTLAITGAETGSYTVHVWQIGEDNHKWSTFTAETYEGKSDTYLIDFDSVTGGTINKAQTPTSTPEPTPTPQCIKHPSLRALPHWCKSRVFYKICQILKVQISVLQKKQTGCKGR